MSELLQAFKNISTFVFDVDGVLTDGTVLVLGHGIQARRMHIKDGLALQMAIRKNYRVLVISGGNSPEVKERLAKLGIPDVHMEVTDKQSLLASYITANGLRTEEVLYMGDDLPDLAVMNIAGLPCCPADAAPEVKEIARYISPLNGGAACVREVIEKVLRLNDDWHFEEHIRSR